MVKAFIILTLALNSVFITKEDIKCNENTIKNCRKCKTGENSDSCEVCDDKYFPFFSDLFCLPCNDLTYGQIGCEGNCDGTNYTKTRFPLCEINGCKEGYYNLNGICESCNISSPGWKICTYEVQEDKSRGNFVCHECINSEYRLSDGKCEHCNIANCEICHYKNNSKAMCDKCFEEFYLDLNGECSKCIRNLIYGGECLICSGNETEYDSLECYCHQNYAKVGNSECIKCPEGCQECIYNNKINDTECIKCNDNYYLLNENKKCIYCWDSCESCSLDKKNNPLCKSCYSGIFLENNKCLLCSEGCDKCKINETSLYKNESECTECYYDWVLGPDKKCSYCKNILEIGGVGCGVCRYNMKISKFECVECSNDNFVYINNEYQCLDNIDLNKIFLIGCLEAIYHEKNNTYEWNGF